MGVRSLETFLKNDVPNGVFEVHILDEIEASKSNNPDAPITLVFDVMGMLHGFYNCLDPIERLCGGNYKKLHDIFDEFFRVLINAGTKLVFFNDGPVQDSKIETWSTRRNSEYQNYCYILDEIEANIALNMIPFQEINFSPKMSAAIMDLIQLCKKYGMYKVAIETECDTEVAKYATENNCFAVMGNDTDYIIYEGDWKYWSVKDLNSKNWNTLEFNKQALREYLDLNQKQMILFSMISGNDVIPTRWLKNLHKKIRRVHNVDGRKFERRDRTSHFYDISKYVKRFPLKLTKKEVQILSQDIFFSQSEENLALIDEAIKFYDINIEPKITDRLWLKAAVHSYGMYNILAGIPYSLSIPLYDLRRTDFLQFHEIVFPLLARIVGLVRQHMDDLSYVQIVETKIEHTFPYMQVNLYPEYPPVLIPDLMELTFHENDRRYQRLRFTLIKWLIFDDVQSTLQIDEIPHGYMVTILTLMYLLRMNQITILEADAILLTIYHVNENIQVECKAPSHIDCKTLIIVSLYTQLHIWMAECFNIVGMGKFIDHLVFDGVLFVHVLNSLKSHDSEAYDEAIDIVRFYRTFFLYF